MATAVTSERSVQLRGFRTVQRLACACGEAVAARFKPGVTEREAARMRRQWLGERGVGDRFHLPFAWFGDRAADIGCSGSLGVNPVRNMLMADLRAHRGLILREVRERRSSLRPFGCGTQSLKGRGGPRRPAEER
ncbi:hypothetical protein GCM10010254_05050 [Streptomyces chromofuscus]|uniref:M24 family metallopeptidase n=1 Tax=Streptomyces chromofuscus TaxID=42881 RepID=A0A7M2T1N6_STRCW|nr:M24 family metallopeptidase [Streptomyces chromofuscus]GGS88159.1 hypothetical protein GCM10010254_05050 [Streptomyces chromofuscus]